MFPVYIFEEDMELPESGNYFLVSGNGLWLHKDTGIVKGFVPVDNISVLQDLNADAFVQCSLPKLPAQHVWKIQTFFKQIVKKFQSEASTTLYFNKSTNEFKVYVPEQVVSHASVNYERKALTHLEEMKDFLCVGTIHSHCNFGAFHSGTDVGDEEDFDGLHVTFGHNNLDEFSISATIVVNGKRLEVDPLEVLEGIEPVIGQDRKYKFADFAQELIEEWSVGLGDWISKVTGPKSSWWKNDSKFRRGQKVSWVGDLKTVAFKETCGDGPFVVDSCYNGLVTIVTKVGMARFSEKLFKISET